ncbi:MAG: hypothetical protein ACRC62_09665, partial [Microcoleus sp.]
MSKISLPIIWDEQRPKKNIWSFVAKYDRSASLHYITDDREPRLDIPEPIACDILQIKTIYQSNIVTIEFDLDRAHVEKITI